MRWNLREEGFSIPLRRHGPLLAASAFRLFVFSCQGYAPRYVTAPYATRPAGTLPIGHVITLGLALELVE